jgi:hypothetical protein
MEFYVEQKLSWYGAKYNVVGVQKNSITVWSSTGLVYSWTIEELQEALDEGRIQDVTPVPSASVPPEKTLFVPPYVVGDRFLFTDSMRGDFAEIIQFDAAGAYFKKSWSDGDCHKSWQNLDGLVKLGYFSHMSGPTWKPPVKKPMVQCNCPGQITGKPCSDWCVTKGIAELKAAKAKGEGT